MNENIRHAIIFINCHPSKIWSHAQAVIFNVPFSFFSVLVDLLLTLKRKKGKKGNSKLKSKKVKNGKDILEKKLKELNNSKGKEKKNEVKGSFCSLRAILVMLIKIFFPAENISR